MTEKSQDWPTHPPTPTFLDPPIIELVLGVQFSPLTKLTSGHFGLFWKSLSEEWSLPSDAPALSDEFETFDVPPWRKAQMMQFSLGPAPTPGRFMVTHRNGDRLIQMQPSRFHLNWRKKDGQTRYLSYKTLIAEFEEAFKKFSEFVRERELGTILPNQWELTYVNAFPKGPHWKTPADWSNVLPSLFSDLFPVNGLGIGLDGRSAEWSYEIIPKLGRLHIAAGPGLWEGNESLLLRTTARGPIDKSNPLGLRAGLDLGHDAAVGVFLKVTSPELKTSWREQK